MKSEIDKSLVSKNLSLTPEERVKNHQGALDFVFNLKNAVKVTDDKSKRTFKKTP